MKVFILTTLLAVFVANSHQRTFSELTQMWHANVLRHSDKCIMESGADRELALRVVRHGEYINDHKVMCFIRCICENLFVIWNDGSIHHGNFLDILYVDEPKILARAAFIENCFDLPIADHCEKAFRVSECIYKAIEKAMKEDEN